MSIELKPHNEETYKKVNEKLNIINRVAVIQPTGTGKMYIALKMLEENKEKRAIYIAPSNTILHDVKKNIFAEGMTMSDFPNLRRMTYQKLATLSDDDIEKLDFDIIVLDEFHHCGAPEWGKGVERLIQKNPNANILGLSATPLRYFDDLKDMSEELFANNVASEMTLEEAIEQGILPEATYVSTLYGYDAELENMQENINKIKDKEKREKAQSLLESLSKRLDENTRNLPELFAEHMKNQSGKYIVFCRNIQDMQEKMEQASKMFEGVNSNITVRSVSAKIKENDKILSDFENDDDEQSLKLLYTVDMLNEGYHVKDLDGVIMMRPTLSPTIFTQQLGRALTVGGDKIPVVLDLVNNFSNCKIIEDFTERMKQYKGKTDTRLLKQGYKSRITILDKTKEFREIANKITELSKRNTISLEEKIQIFEKFSETGEELRGDTIFEGYPVGQWSTQIRYLIKRKNEEKSKALKINPTEEQLDRLENLGILEGRVESTIDEKIERLVQWMTKYPKVEIRTTIPTEVLREYASTEEEYVAITTQYKRMQKYYEYIRVRKSQNKLTEEQISKCKEGNVKGVFGYPSSIEELAKKTGKPKKDMQYIINCYGTIEHFIDVYRNGGLDEKDSTLAASMIRNVIDIDLNPNREGYDALYAKIRGIEQTDNTLELYSSEKLKERLKTLGAKAELIIGGRYNLSSDLPNSLTSLATELEISHSTISHIEENALRKLRHPSNLRKISYEFNKSDMLTEEESRRIDDIEKNLYKSDFIFRHNPQEISRDNVANEEVLKAFKLIKNMDEITQERKEQREQEVFHTPLENTNISVKAYMYLQKIGVSSIGELRSLSSQDASMLLRQLGKQAYIDFWKEVIKYDGDYVGIEYMEDMTEEQIEEMLKTKEQDKKRMKLDVTMEELDFSIQTYNCLKRAGINTLEDLSNLTEEELRKINSLGKRRCDEIVQKLEYYGVTLKDDIKHEDSRQQAYQPKGEDTFIKEVLEKATRRVEVREKEKQARQLSEQYEELFEEKNSKDEHSLDFDDNE